ncbi:MAG: CoA transferase [Chloroflexi bacterium]|nr:CoA transferase [Chloroflexota bacterium]
MEDGEAESALGPYRVLDMADESGILCTKIFAALGADVIKVEPPGGDPARRLGPFYRDDANPEKSLHWFTYNLNKRSVTLNIENEAGQALFKRLVKTADFLVECFRPGYLDRLGLGYSELCKVNNRLIHVSVSPFGSGGPYGKFKGSPLVCAAMSGHMFLVGDPDRPPVELATPAAYIQNGVATAAAAMVAFWYRVRTGKGQHVDASVQESFAAQIHPVAMMWKCRGIIAQRGVTGARLAGRPDNRGIFKCRDGYVNCHTTYAGGRAALREWLAAEGMAGDLFNPRWSGFFKGEPVSEEQKACIDALFQAFAIDKTTKQLMHMAQEKGIQVARENTVLDVINDPQLREREYFVRVEHPELGDSILCQGAPYKCDELPWEYRRRAPFIGEHNKEIYQGELGLSPQEMAILLSEGAI